MASSSSSSQYPYPSTLNPTSFVTVKLSGIQNYSLWEAQIHCLIKSQELVGFINGTILAPSKTIKPMEYSMWRRSDRLVKVWILSTLNEDVLATVVGLSTAMDVWTKLSLTFNPNPNHRENEVKEVAAPTIQDPQLSNVAPTTVKGKGNDISWYLPLYKAALVGDWETTKSFLDRENEAETAIITRNKETLLYVAVATGKAIHYVEKLVERLPKEALVIKKNWGQTALSVAAMVGNAKAAKVLIEKNKSLLYIATNEGSMPLDLAAYKGHWDTYSYLQSVSSDDDYAGQNGVDILSYTLTGGRFDIALDLIKRFPHVARLEPSSACVPPLSVISGKTSSFRSGYRLNFLQSFIYSCIRIKFDGYFDEPSDGDFDIEDPTTKSKALTHKMVHSPGVPAIKDLRDKKLVHHQAVQLVKCLCEGIRSTYDQNAYSDGTLEPITKAVSLGIVEVVEGIVDILPVAFWSCNPGHNYIIQLAAKTRCERVYNLVYQMNGYQHYIKNLEDDEGNNILHLAGQLAPEHKLNLVSGTALQLQRELQWFKEVEKFNPASIERMNNSGDTPAMVFTREHKHLVVEGEKWMKDTANSCTIAASLIITMVFAAAITIPGGNNDHTGFPIFNNKGHAFLIFAVSDAISLFTSTTSLLMFLSILTARYAEQDFLHALPKRLVIGLLTLFISISSMVLAFSATVYLVFGEERGWVIIPLVAFSCLTVTSFVTLQFPLLIDVFSSMAGCSLFGKHSDRPFH